MLPGLRKLRRCLAATASAPSLLVEPARPLSPPLPAARDLLERDECTAGRLLQRGMRASMAQVMPDLCGYLLGTKQGELLRAAGGRALLRQLEQDTAPLPQPEDRQNYYGNDHVAYWLSGLGDALLVRHYLQQQRGLSHTLDLGCSSGRVLRHLARDPDLVALGTDIDQGGVEWIRRHLEPAATAFQGTVLPHLPFEDRSLHLVSAFSVFPHIDEHEAGWLLELHRVLVPGGIALITFHSEAGWECLRDPQHALRQSFASTPHEVDGAPVTVDLFDRPMPGPRVVLREVRSRGRNANVFHSHSYVRERWGRRFVLDEIVAHAHGSHQDLAVLRRPGACAWRVPTLGAAEP